MSKYENIYTSNNTYIEQLMQMRRIVWDGDLISKFHRDQLVKSGMAYRASGYNLITKKGIRTLSDLNLIRS